MHCISAVLGKEGPPSILGPFCTKRLEKSSGYYLTISFPHKYPHLVRLELEIHLPNYRDLPAGQFQEYK